MGGGMPALKVLALPGFAASGGRHRQIAAAYDHFRVDRQSNLVSPSTLAFYDHSYCLHYNDERPHRSRSLRPPAHWADPIAPSDGQISRTVRFGGLLSAYRRVPVAA